MTVKKLPSISILLPTLNAERTLKLCLQSISGQNYPKNKIEIIVADGGSKDKTLEIAKKYDTKIILNLLKTAEAGKAIALKKAKNEIVAFIDSDNILPDKDWLQKMIEPFEEKDIILSEPWEYSYRKEDGFIDRYLAMIGMNDPICLFIGNYDRKCLLTNKWTGLKFQEEDKGRYLKIKLDHEPIPTIGANGTMIKKSEINNLGIADYLFDVDLLLKIMKKKQTIYIAKVKIGIIHTFAGSSIKKFIRKQMRRISDMSYYSSKNSRNINWEKTFLLKIIIFQIECLLVIPIILQMVYGFVKKPDIAWLFHPLACYSTWFIYLYGWLKGKIQPMEQNRNNWGQ